MNEKSTARFWAKVDRSAGPDGCWPWMGARKKAGYGNFFIRRDPPTAKGRMLFMNAHKLAYVLTYGSPPEGQLIRHTCDNPPCCNPAHLISGTNTDNVQDAISRGRINHVLLGNPEGLRAAARKRRRFSDEDLIEIVAALRQGASYCGLARQRGLSDSAIWNIFHGKSYRDVPIVQEYIETTRERAEWAKAHATGPICCGVPMQQDATTQWCERCKFWQFL